MLLTLATCFLTISFRNRRQFEFGNKCREKEIIYWFFFSMLKIYIFILFYPYIYINSIQRFRNRFMQCRKHVKFFPFLLFRLFSDFFFSIFSIWINKDGLNFFLSVFLYPWSLLFYFLFYLTNIVCPKGMLCLQEIVMSLSIHPK